MMWARRLYIPALVLLVFGYPLTMVWFLYLGIASSTLNMGVKGLVAVLFAAALIGGIVVGRRLSPTAWPLLLFLGFYGIRLLVDVLGLGIVSPFTTPSYVLLYFFGLTLLPALAVSFSFKGEDIPRIHRWMFWALVLVNLSLLFHVSQVGSLADEDLLSGRLQVTGEDEATAVLNPIVVSLMGAALCLFVMGRLAIWERMGWISQALHFGLFGIGVGNLLLGGSRGPIIVLAGGLFLVMASIFLAQRSGRRGLGLKPRVVMYMAAILIGLVFLAAQETVTIGVFDRFRDMLDPSGRRVEAREYIYSAAWRDFLSAPLTGKSYLTVRGTAMPHNAPIEALMALGLFGGALYFVSLLFVLKGIWKALRLDWGVYSYPVNLVAFGFFIMTMTSGSIAGSPEFWVMTALATCFSRSYRSALPPRSKLCQLPETRSPVKYTPVTDG